MGVDKIDITKIPLEKISGEFVKINEKRQVLFPQILEVFDTSFSLTALDVYDGYYLNDKLIYIFRQIDNEKVLYNLNQEYDTPFYKGFCVFGDVFFIFYSDKCLVINTGKNEIKTVSITIDNTPMNTILFRQITPQLFSVITSNPTTIHLFGLDSAGDIASAQDGSTVNINSFTYATFSNPMVNIDLIYFEDMIYLLGDDYTVILKLEMKDIVYLHTLKTYNYRYTPFFQEFEDVGIKFIRETQSFYIFYNTLYNTYLYITKDMKNVYLGKDTVFLLPTICLKASENKFYRISDILQSEFIDTDNYHEISFRFETTYLVIKNVFALISEVQKSSNVPPDTVERVASLVIEARYDNGYNIWSYGLLYNKNSYRISVRGESFVITLYSKKALRLEELSLWV